MIRLAEATTVVKKIFDLCVAGEGPMQIAKELTEFVKKIIGELEQDEDKQNGIAFRLCRPAKLNLLPYGCAALASAFIYSIPNSFMACMICIFMAFLAPSAFLCSRNSIIIRWSFMVSMIAFSLCPERTTPFEIA